MTQAEKYRSLAEFGYNVTEAAEVLGVSPTTVRNFAKSIGVKFSDGREYADRNEEYRRLAYLGHTAKEVSEILGVAYQSVYDAEKRLGIQFRRVQPRGAKTTPAFTVKPEAIARYVAASKAKQSRQPRPGG